MTVEHFLTQAAKLEIQEYRRPQNLNSLRQSHVPFSGAPRRHPQDPQKIVLIPDPYSTQLTYFEFSADDVTFAEELPNIVTIEGETIPMARIWIKKSSLGLRCEPFLVADTLHSAPS